MRNTLILACVLLGSVGPPVEGDLHRFKARKELAKRMKLQGYQGAPKGKSNIVIKQFKQKVDHLTPSNTETWMQRYAENMQFYGKNNLIFLRLGGEGEMNENFLSDVAYSYTVAQKCKAAMFLLEHRFYGPVWPRKALTLDALKLLSADQALEDIAYFITQKNIEMKLQNPRWIVFGGSYAGSLAAWVRYKHPKLVYAAVASSAPVFAKVDFPEYYETVSKGLDTIYGPKCTAALREAFKTINTEIRNPATRKGYTKIFNLCYDLDGTVNDLENFINDLVSPFSDLIQSYWPQIEPPNVKSACDHMTNTKIKSPVARLAAVIKDEMALNNRTCFYSKYMGYVEFLRQTDFKSQEEGSRQWMYQTCAEFGWFQTTHFGGSAFGESHVTLYTNWCKDIFGPRFDAAAINKYTKETNADFKGYGIPVTNVVFVHGSIDPWHPPGIVKNPPKGSYAIFIKGASHCADIYSPNKGDPPGIKKAQDKITELLTAWVAGKNPTEKQSSFVFS